MVKRETSSCRGGAGAKTGRLALALLLLGLAGCNPVETYRHWTGIAENDPNPATTPNTKNLAAGDATSYPNLATVPPPPSQALTTAELNKLTQSLIADRANAKYTSEQLQTEVRRSRGAPAAAAARARRERGEARAGLTRQCGARLRTGARRAGACCSGFGADRLCLARGRRGPGLARRSWGRR